MHQPIDPALEDLHNRVGIARHYIESAYKAGLVSMEVYQKAMVDIAYEYAVAGYADETLITINGISGSYFLNHSTKHMEEDPEFYARAKVVAETLIHGVQVNVFGVQPVASA